MQVETAGPPDYLALLERLNRAEAECERLRAEVFDLRVKNERLRVGLEQAEFAARAALGEADDD